jgi:hypothetical protein
MYLACCVHNEKYKTISYVEVFGLHCDKMQRFDVRGNYRLASILKLLVECMDMVILESGA